VGLPPTTRSSGGAATAEPHGNRPALDALITAEGPVATSDRGEQPLHPDRTFPCDRFLMALRSIVPGRLLSMGRTVFVPVIVLSKEEKS
jgi:hypothetical protein